MFGTLRKHSTWLWVFIIVIVSLSMVVFFSSSTTLMRGAATKGDYGSIGGRPITQAEYYDAQKEVMLSQFIHSGKWPGGDEASKLRTENETISRVFLVQKLKEMDIHASDKAVGMMEHEQLGDHPLPTFEQEVLLPNKLRIDDYLRLVRNEAAIRQLIAAASVSARLVTSAEAESLWRKENQDVAGQLAVFWTSNYLDKVAITNGAISNFYTLRLAQYRVPERLIIEYVEFSASNYLAEADKKLAQLTNLNDIVSEYYFRGRNDTNRWTDTNGAPLPEAAAKEKIKEEIRTNEGLLSARRAASDFGTELMNQPDPNKIDNLEKLATAKGMTLKTTKPFDHITGLEEFDDQPLPARSEDSRESVRDVIRTRAFALTDDKPVLFTPIPGRQGVYVIARKGKVPSELQPLEKIQDKVTADYKTFMAFQAAQKAGLAFQTTLTNGLALKKSFTDICAAEKVKVIDLPPFSVGTASLTNVDARVNLPRLQNAAHDLEVGQASALLPAQPGSEGGYILYVKARLPIDEAKLKAALPGFVSQMRVYRQNEAFQQWFRKQVEQAKVMAPKHEPSTGGRN